MTADQTAPTRPVCSCCDARLDDDGNCPSRQPCCTRPTPPTATDDRGQR